MLKISVVTCTRNAAHTIGRTLRSVGSQDYPRVEHIIMDSLSVDSTLQQVEEYQTTNNSSHEIVVLSEHDDGLYYAMNKAIRRATGDYLLFLNAGDTFPTEATLSHVMAVASEGDTLPGVLFGDTDLVDDEGRFVRHRRLHPRETLSWRDFKEGMLVCHQAFYALTAIARQTEYDTRYRYSADVDWCIRTLKRTEEEGREVRNVHHVVVNYLEGGLTTANHRKSLAERFRVMCHHYGTVRTVLFHLWFVLRALLRR